MWDKTKTGWLMSLRDSPSSNWGSIEGFYESVRSEKKKNGKFIVDSEVWGTLRDKRNIPNIGDGFAFYHNSRARFQNPDPYNKKPRITLVGELLDVSCTGREVDWIKVEIDPVVLNAMELSPIVRNDATKHIFQECGIIPGPVATFYFANSKAWREIIRIVKESIY